jgi:hypothetical protein
LLRALDVPESSQLLVFSKTSLQREFISPAAPRAIYFNDDVMVGFCLDGRLLELAAVNEGSGTAFYTLDQTQAAERPRLERQGLMCVGCHATKATLGVSGLLVRSLSVDAEGRILLDQAMRRTDHSSPLTERWGGWYVTGTSGRQQHLGNRIGPLERAAESPEEAAKVSVLDPRQQFPASRYLTPHSDIVALMVFEHQVGMLNRLARAGIEGRRALRAEGDLGALSETSRARLQEIADAVVEHLLFADEAPLIDPIEGSSSFAQDFAARGARDLRGRSLREFDLHTRLFRYPCSYLIYSRAFDSLPEVVQQHVYRRLWERLAGPDAAQQSPHLSPEDRQAIVEILRETKRDLPDYWRGTASG